MINLDFEPAVLCLLGSLAWAPFVYLIATRLDRGRTLTSSEMLWLAALGVAALPTLIAPALAAAGISLRPSPSEAALPLVLAAPVDFGMSTPEIAALPAAPEITARTLINAASLLYIYGVLLAFGVWLTRSFFFAVHVRRAKAIDHPQLIAALESWRRRLDVSPRLEVRVSNTVSSVCVYGIFRPVIIVPSDLNARVSFEDFVMMCAHELAHIKRGDCRLFAASAAARILFWFNPFVKRIAARAELAAEQSADALVLHCGADRRAYAACFVEGLRFAAERAQVSRLAVPSFTPFDRKSRRDRLDAILSGEEKPRRTPSRLVIGAAVAVAGGLAVAQAAVAVQPSARPLGDAIIESLVAADERLDDAAAPPDAKAAIAANASATALAEAAAEGRISLAYGAAVEGAEHRGVDIKAPRGASVQAPADGVVLDATDVYKGQPNWGKVVVIRHKDGLITRFAHLDSYSVKKGDRVKRGDAIGAVGSTGKSTGPHLHFEALIEGEAVDPATVLGLSAPVAPAKPAKPIRAAKPVIAASPAAAADPVQPLPRREPSDALDPIESLDLELEGAKAPAPREFKGFASLAPELFSGEKNVTRHGDNTFSWKLADGGDFAFSLQEGWSDEDRKALKESLRTMRQQIAEAKKAHAKTMEEMRLSLSDLQLDGESLSEFSASAVAQARGAIALSEKERARIGESMKKAFEESKRAWAHAEQDRAHRERDLEQARRDREQAWRDQEQARRDEAQAKRDREQAKRDREEAQREAWAERHAALVEEATQRAQELAEREAERAQLRAEREAERAEREAELAAEQAERDAERAAEQAEREAERAAEEAERQAELEAWAEEREQRREMLKLREQALEEAERDLVEERAEIERMREEIDSDSETEWDAQ